VSRFTLLQAAAIVGIGGSVLVVAVPAFVEALAASKLSEPLDGLRKITTAAAANAEHHEQRESFPPGAELTPSEVPRGVRVKDPPGTWNHLTWHALAFKMEDEHAFSFKFESAFDSVTNEARFVATAHGDLDGDGNLSTFQVQGMRAAGQPARALPGLFVDRELE
jgi:hypothetical protein